jgi:hypothetical protein
MKHRALIIGAGRIGAGYNWHDDAYTHAGAYRALSDQVELVGFVEPDLERRVKANLKWKVPTYESVKAGLEALEPTIVSVCVQPEQQQSIFNQMFEGPGYGVDGVWCEKPFVVKDECGISCLTMGVPVQVSYMRRGDRFHQVLAENPIKNGTLIVYGKDDIHTKCHFEDLAKWWKVPLDYRTFNGPCAYILKGTSRDETYFFDAGGVDGGECFRAMLGNLLDHVDNGTPLWSPANG